ncbi:hypothetical protein W04_0260 [Pseudoalteromonas sp. SW0106-04]|nr:hypothetical protein W04_0260 [Pseudoalteromonas sp. SW0106-04]
MSKPPRVIVPGSVATALSALLCGIANSTPDLAFHLIFA